MINKQLYPCPCCPATKCEMDKPCLGCETYAEWFKKKKKAQDLPIRERIKQHRKKYGYNQAEMARKIGVGWRTYNRWEKGVCNPSKMAMQRLMKEGI